MLDGRGLNMTFFKDKNNEFINLYIYNNDHFPLPRIVIFVHCRLFIIISNKNSFKGYRLQLCFFFWMVMDINFTSKHFQVVYIKFYIWKKFLGSDFIIWFNRMCIQYVINGIHSFYPQWTLFYSIIEQVLSRRHMFIYFAKPFCCNIQHWQSWCWILVSS